MVDAGSEGGQRVVQHNRRRGGTDTGWSSETPGWPPARGPEPVPTRPVWDLVRVCLPEREAVGQAEPDGLVCTWLSEA